MANKILKILEEIADIIMYSIYVFFILLGAAFLLLFLITITYGICEILITVFNFIIDSFSTIIKNGF